ncbi:PREDICTED: stromal membrane-associated protein 1 [Nicrophorus vespilloides]|uniref:Stromal membrane-associated protein 1 n=1 Tax=Nicrophorus vespilloides TaxID=110193 RepID=A0ABM1MU43_NICVS|nr:PREDICTED: stromal membrane-associated protein 1 [Nicrophorus vespilloides]
MTTKAEKEKAKQLQEKCQSVLNALLRDEDNKYCVDCDSKGPRWSSWNLGVFLCIRCAGIHRNLGVHISKVKSVNLDSWTPEQVVSLQQMGNSRARAVYEANLPDSFRRPQNDPSLETFIRAKYEHKKYIAREWVPPSLPEVNWEKEIDEEIERQKRKKTSVMENKSHGAVEVPQLPKPKTASPKPGRINPIVPPKQENKQNADLLGLQNGDDSFSNFLSAPAPVAQASSEKKEDEKVIDPAKSEEESFFNQTTPTVKGNVKLTKDSILALYGSAPINNFTQPANNFQQPSHNFSGAGSYNPPTNYQQMTSFAPAISNFNQTATGNFTQATPANFNNVAFNAYHQPQQYPNQFSMQYNTIGQSTNNALGNQFNNQQPMQGSQFQMNQFPRANAQLSQQTPNPFFSQSNLQQQFGNLHLNGSNGASATPPTLASNIWQ